MKTQLPWWLQNTIFCGSEDGDEGDNNEGDGAGEGDDAGDDGSKSGEGKGGEGDSGSSDDDDTAGLKSALEKERARAKKLERENNRLKRTTEKKTEEATDEEKKDLEEAQARATKSEEKAQRLATRLLNSERDAAIKAEAERLNFIDPTDALTDAIRNAVEVDQDDEDPSDIEVDLSTVKAAVKKLADSKKHLIGKPNEGNRSGTRVRKDSNSAGEKGYDASAYPSLS